MKTKILTLALLLSSMPALAAQKQVTATVKGMVCGFCAQGITKKLQAEPSVEKVDVSLEKKLVTIDLKQGKDIANDQIEKILKDSGYNVEKIERN
jgi:copper chaperone CopZ